MALRTTAGPSFFDAEHDGDAGGGNRLSAEFFLGLLLGMLLVSALIGYVLGIALFIFLFLWKRAQMKVLYAALGAAGFVLFLGILSDQLTLRYPTGLLQTYLGIDLPWPLQ